MNILKQVQPEDQEIIGFWGLVTATQDWCEDNYTYTHYIAEFWNTLSNFFIMFFGILGLVSAIRSKCEKRFYFSYTGLLIVGCGSFVFHCTLQWKAQLLDEVPMIICSMPLIYSLVASDMVSKTKLKILQIVLTLYPLIVIPYYVITRDYLVFIIAYGLTVVIMVFYSQLVIRRINKMVPQSQQIYPNNPKQLIFRSIFFYGVAFILWNIDNELCGDLKNFKMLFPENIRPLLELHAWWHFGSGYGTYLCIVFSQVCYKINKQYLKGVKMNENKYEAVCYYKTYLPYIQAVKTNQNDSQLKKN